jgi:hypothetical protein
MEPFQATGQILYNVIPFSNTPIVSAKINEGQNYVGKETIG